jgi:hypothetical protein
MARMRRALPRSASTLAFTAAPTRGYPCRTEKAPQLEKGVVLEMEAFLSVTDVTSYWVCHGERF